jgi:SNF2 family DNA or RNA helicase
MKPSEVIKFSRPLWKHQADTLDWDAYMTEVALLHEMGTGKTTSAIGWLRCKYNMRKQVLPTFIVSPVATLYNWLEEFERNSPEGVHSKACVLEGTEKQKLKLLASDKQIFITNPETLNPKTVGKRTIHSEVHKALQARNFQALVVDEVHRFKNHKSKRLDELLFISDRAEFRMVLTGTLILNSYLDIWAPWRILDKGTTFGTNFYTFRDQYFQDANARWKGNDGYFPKFMPKPGTDHEVAAMIDRKASRVKKSECLTLPPLVEQTYSVELSAEQRRIYKSMEDELIAEVKSGVCVASNALTRVLRMLQIISGFLQIENDDNQKFTHRLLDNPRLKALSELLEELTPNHKVIVWCTFKENYASVAAVCDELGIKYTTLTGETKDRQGQIDLFQDDDEYRVKIANPQAGGIGVNLTAASYSIYFSRNFSLGDRLQSEARDYRGGSERHDKITHIDIVARDTMDLDVLNALLRKENFSDNVLDRLRTR